jgi:hypothetical protein
MKKIILFFCALAAYGGSNGQTIAGGDMESWRSTTSGVTTPTTVQAPNGWYGVDSIIIGLGQSFNTLLGTTDADWRTNLFREDANVHGGTHSAKIMTRIEDTLVLPGIMSTAQTHVGIVIFPTPSITGITFSGGNPVTVKPTSVSAWVQYFPGRDTSGAIGVDSATFNVQALSHIGGKDSVIGTGSVTIGASSSWVQVTVNVTYPVDSTYPVDTMRIAFASSKPATALDSSTLYVDDVTMTSIPNPVIDHTAVHTVVANDQVKVYPNPASGYLYFSSPADTRGTAVLYTLSGQVARTISLTGFDKMDVATLASGLYFYTVYDSNGNAAQRGKIAVN